MNESPKVFRPRYREGLFGAISVGFFFILIGAIFVVTPNLFDKVQTFFQDFKTEAVPHTENIFVPAPATPREHTVVYTATWEFSLIWGVFEIFILALRFVVGSPFSKKGGNCVWHGFLVGRKLRCRHVS